MDRVNYPQIAILRPVSYPQDTFSRLETEPRSGIVVREGMGRWGLGGGIRGAQASATLYQRLQKLRLDLFSRCVPILLLGLLIMDLRKERWKKT
jgi:hypothetical protein